MATRTRVAYGLELAILLAAIAGCATVGQAAAPVAAQPDLKMLIENAPYLKPDDLGPAAFSVTPPTSAGANLAVNPDGKSYDALLWYYQAYATKLRVYIIDFGANTISRQNFTEAEGRVRVEQGFTWWGVTAPNGTIFGAAPDSVTNKINIYCYDAAKNRVEIFAAVDHSGGERTPIVLSPDGWIYGGGTYVSDDADGWRRCVAYGFNPSTGEVRSYGPVGPRIDGTAYSYTLGCDDTHIYIACGKIPWYLVAVNIKTGEQTVLAEAPEGGQDTRMNINSHYGGAEVFVQKGDDAPKEHFWLYHCKAIPKTGNAPWGDLKAPRPAAAPEPELYLDDTYPNEKGESTLWWRPRGEEQWRKLTLTGVETHPLTLHRLIALPDGRIFGVADGYTGRFLFDPKTNKVTSLGDGARSVYALAQTGGKVYISGYSSAPIFEFDPDKPWTLQKGGPPGTATIEETEAGSNPRRVHKDDSDVFNKTRVKKMLSAVVAADGKVYFGGIGQRDYEGGGLAWYDPKTGDIGGLWKPFAGCGIGWVSTACDGRYIVASTSNRKAFVFDTQTKEVVNSFEPVPGAQKAGPMLEVAPGRMIGTTDDPKVAGAGILYGIEIPSGKTLFTKPLPYSLQFTWSQGTDPVDYQRDRRGYLWTFLGNALVRIDPKDARVDVVGKLYELGTMAFDGDDLYLTGTTQVRRLTGVVANAEALIKQATDRARTAAQPVVVQPGAPKVIIPFEAQTGALQPPMQVGEVAEAAGGKYVFSDKDKEGAVSFDFTVPAADDYVIWARTFGPSYSADSFFVIVDGGVQDIFDVAEGAAAQWHWLLVNGRGSSGPESLNPRVFRLAAGKHTLVIRGREPGARLARLVITNDRAFNPEKP